MNRISRFLAQGLGRPMSSARVLFSHYSRLPWFESFAKLTIPGVCLDAYFKPRRDATNSQVTHASLVCRTTRQLRPDCQTGAFDEVFCVPPRRLPRNRHLCKRKPLVKKSHSHSLVTIDNFSTNYCAIGDLPNKRLAIECLSTSSATMKKRTKSEPMLT